MEPGKPYGYAGPTCHCAYPGFHPPHNPMPTQYMGWQCPICDLVYSPQHEQCGPCNTTRKK